MITCQNCGKFNTPETNFCRSCGTKFTSHQAPPVNPYDQRPAANPYDYPAPHRPYSWKTDEFQTQNEPRKTVPIDRVRPLNDQFTQAAPSFQPAPLAYQQPQYPAMQFRCPHCMSQYPPRIDRHISTAGWVTFALLLVFFFPLFWIGLLMKEETPVCSTCNGRLGPYQR